MIINFQTIGVQAATGHEPIKLINMPKEISEIFIGHVPSGAMNRAEAVYRTHFFDLNNDQKEDMIILISDDFRRRPQIGIQDSFVICLMSDGTDFHMKGFVRCNKSYLSGIKFFRRQGSRPAFFALSDFCAASAGCCQRRFFAITPQGFGEILDSFCTGGSFHWVDLNEDGTNELVFRHRNDKYNRADEILEWNDEESKFDFNNKFPAYWQSRISAVLSLYEAMNFPDRSVIRLSERLAIWYRLRGGTEGVEDFLKICAQKLEPFIRDDRNDHMQSRARIMKVQVDSILEGKMDDAWPLKRQ